MMDSLTIERREGVFKGRCNPRVWASDFFKKLEQLTDYQRVGYFYRQNIFFKKRKARRGDRPFGGGRFWAAEPTALKSSKTGGRAGVKYRADQIAQHHQKLLHEASRMVDSMCQRLGTKLQDSLGHIRPDKPGKPEDIPPIDSAVVKPLF